MVETPKADQDLRFRNVSLHSCGRTEHGTLYLSQHHLRFSYYPNIQKNESSISAVSNGHFDSKPTQTRLTPSTESSTLTKASVASTGTISTPEASGSSDQSGTDRTVPGNDTKPEPKDEKHRPRPKDIWVPYPMINYCVLRLSHTVGHVVRPQAANNQVHGANDADELFPPIFGTASYGRPSTDSARLAPYSTPPRPTSPASQNNDAVLPTESARQPAIRIRRRDFQMMALHFHQSQSETSPDETARQVFYVLRSRCCVDRVELLHAFHFHPLREEAILPRFEYDARREYARMGISSKAADGPGKAWRISDINRDYSYSATYPNVLCVPRSVSDNMLKYGGAFRSRSRIPCLAYLHSNGGSITRSSQPMVGVQNKRNPQDERLVSAIFSSHTPTTQSPEDSPPQLPSLTSLSTTTLESSSSDPATLNSDVPGLPISHSDTALDEKADEKTTPLRKKIYGSTRRNLIVDARPKINALANRATGGGIEDIANYMANGDMQVEKVFLNIANIHVMRASLDKVFDSFANSDYIEMKPDQESLRKSGWLGHIAGLLDGSEMVARVVGLGGSHVLVHCSDGWDRTAQVSALAQIMLEPHYRTMEGFISLIQKDFLSFGHKFRERSGIKGSEKWFEIENERIAPSRNRENNSSDPSSLNALSAKALTGAKSWFEKNRGNLFRQQNSSRENLAEDATSRPSSPPPNPLLHSPPSSTSKDDKEHKMSEKEISPVFHQFLDAMYQLLHQEPNAFEFSERFLRRLFFHTYACQYGEFLFNTEQDRSQHMGKLPSVWMHFLSRRHEFINPDFAGKADDPLLFPRRGGIDREVQVRWWSALFGRTDKEMNLPRALAPADPLAMTANMNTSVSFDERSTSGPQKAGVATPGIAATKETTSTPSLNTKKDDLASNFSTMNLRASEEKAEPFYRAPVVQQDNDVEMPAKPSTGNHEEMERKEDKGEQAVSFYQFQTEEDGDPLGVTGNKSREIKGSGGLDFAAFASQNAFKE